MTDASRDLERETDRAFAELARILALASERRAKMPPSERKRGGTAA
jgi:hypothetical protein